MGQLTIFFYIVKLRKKAQVSYLDRNFRIFIVILNLIAMIIHFIRKTILSDATSLLIDMLKYYIHTRMSEIVLHKKIR